SVALTAFADADHAGCQDTRQSTSGSVQFMGERLISWSSKRQKSAAISNYGLAFNKIPMYCDNKSAIALCCNNVQHSRSKHIDIGYHFIKEQVENGMIELYFVNTEYQLADLFTKALGRERIEFLINKLGMRSFTPETLKQLMDEVDEDDIIFLTIKVVSRHQNTQQYGAMLPIELTNEEIRNTKAYKEYYAYATGEAAPKPKASARRKRSGFDSSITPPTAVATPRPTIAATPNLTAATKGKQPAKATKAKSLSALSKVAMTEAEQLKLVLKRSKQQMHIS
nr:retrotransposon protein, putative, unclassified [Tanacetum cinerariifolium]